MKIDNLHIKNEAINLKIDNLDFSKCGIYNISGDNGSGKTSLIEAILRNPKLVSDITGDIEKEISYQSQSRYDYKITCREFLATSNKAKLDYYLNAFNIDYLSKNTQNLSGGEYAKILIIRTLLKDSSYIIFDEPTNYLDDDSVIILEQLLNEEKSYKTIIIISHDPRFKLDYDGNFLIHNNELIVQEVNNNKKNSYLAKRGLIINRINIKDILFSTFNSVFLILIIAMSLASALFISSQINDNVTLAPILKYDGYIELLDVAENCPNLSSEILAKHNKIDYCNNKKFLEKKDILEISELKYVNEVYIFDQIYVNSLLGDNSTLEIYSVPDIILNTPHNNISTPCSIDFIIQGRIPYDEKNEIALSELQLRKFFNYDGDINDAVGNKVKLDNKEYTIVGINSVNTACLSFETDYNYGYFKVNEKTIEYIDLISNEKKKSGYSEFQLENIVIVVDESMSDNVSILIEDIILTGHSYQVTSNYSNFRQTITTFIDVIPYLIAVGALLSLISAIIIYSIGSKPYLLIENKISDNNTLTFKYKYNRLLISCAIVIDILIALVLSSIYIQFLYSNMTVTILTLIIILFDLIVITLILLLHHMIRKRYVNS